MQYLQIYNRNKIKNKNALRVQEDILKLLHHIWNLGGKQKYSNTEHDSKTLNVLLTSYGIWYNHTGKLNNILTIMYAIFNSQLQILHVHSL